MTNDRHSEAETESRRILARVSRAAESGGRSVDDRATRGARDHVLAADVEQNDWAEYWGTRIGRILGVVLVVGLIAWLVLFVVRGG